MVELSVCKEIYSKSILMQAKQSYQSLATIEIVENRGSWTVLFSDCKYEEIITAKEFENFLIGLENS